MIINLRFFHLLINIKQAVCGSCSVLSSCVTVSLTERDPVGLVTPAAQLSFTVPPGKRQPVGVGTDDNAHRSGTQRSACLHTATCG